MQTIWFFIAFRKRLHLEKLDKKAALSYIETRSLNASKKQQQLQQQQKQQQQQAIISDSELKANTSFLIPDDTTAADHPKSIPASTSTSSLIFQEINKSQCLKAKQLRQNFLAKSGTETSQVYHMKTTFLGLFHSLAHFY